MASAGDRLKTARPWEGRRYRSGGRRVCESVYLQASEAAQSTGRLCPGSSERKPGCGVVPAVDIR